MEARERASNLRGATRIVVSRRRMLQAGVAGGLMAVEASSKSPSLSTQRTEAVLFDAFAIFDPHIVARAAQEILGARSAEFMQLWRTKQFEYTWLRNSADIYENFWQVTSDSLDYADDQMRFRLGPKFRQALLTYVAFAGWDAVGATWFGYPTFWLNRSQATAEHLSADIQATGTRFDDLMGFIVR